MEKILLSIPNLSGNESKYLQECIDTNFVSSVGEFVNRFENEFADYLGVRKAIAVVNGTAALHLSLVLLGVERGDDVIVPNLTFIAPANAVSYVGANPVFVDSSIATFGIDGQKLEQFLEENYEIIDNITISKKTGATLKVVIPMHTFGMAVDMDPIVALAQKYNFEILEDACEALGTNYKGKKVGTIGKIGCFSFNGNKVITSGGGGMIVTNDLELAKKAKHLSTTAKTENIHFVHDQIGYNYRMVNLLAAVGLAQFEMLDHFLVLKKKNALRYLEGLKGISGIEFHMPQNENESNFWFYSVLIKSDKMSRDEVVSNLISKGIEVRPVWTLMEQLPMYRDNAKSDMLVSRYLRNSLINIPCSTSITEEEIGRVCNAFRELRL